MINPFVLYGAAGLALVAATAGWKVRDWQCDAAYAKAIEKAEKERRQLQKVLDGKSLAYEELRAIANEQAATRTNTIREIYRTLPPVRSDCAPPADAVGVLVQSVGEANAAPAAR